MLLREVTEVRHAFERLAEVDDNCAIRNSQNRVRYQVAVGHSL